MKIYMIPGDPQPWKRAGINRNHRVIYDTQGEVKLYLKILMENQRGSDPLITWPIHMFITFYMYASAKNKHLIGKPHKYRPDLSNLIKFPEDVCNDVIFYDDSLIATITASKIYDENPRTEFYFVPVEDHEKSNGKSKKNPKY